MFCNKCGKQAPENATICPSCGAYLGAPAASSQPQPQPQYQPPQYQPPQPQYQPPQPGYGGYAGYGAPGGSAPIKNRSIVTCILLSIVTCGIYIYFWLYSMVNDLNTASNNPQGTSGGKVILFTILTCGIYLWVWMYKAGEQICVAREQRTGVRGDNSGIVYLLLSLFGLGIVSYALIQSELNKMATC